MSVFFSFKPLEFLAKLHFKKFSHFQGYCKLFSIAYGKKKKKNIPKYVEKNEESTMHLILSALQSGGQVLLVLR